MLPDSEDEDSCGRTSPKKMMSNRKLDVRYMELQVVSACQFPDYGVRGIADITTFVITSFFHLRQHTSIDYPA